MASDVAGWICGLCGAGVIALVVILAMLQTPALHALDIGSSTAPPPGRVERLMRWFTLLGFVIWGAGACFQSRDGMWGYMQGLVAGACLVFALVLLPLMFRAGAQIASRSVR